MAERSNEEWIAALSRPGPEHDAALDDLRLLLVRGLGYALSRRRGIDDGLLEDFAQTDKQRQALVAKIQGMPLEEVARRMGSNRNALYKLIHDARQRLKERLLAEGLAAEEILAAFE